MIFCVLFQVFQSLLKEEILSFWVCLKKEGIGMGEAGKGGQQKDQLRFNSASINTQLSKLEQSCKNMTEQET